MQPLPKNPEGWIPISPATLPCGKPLGIDVYLKTSPSSKAVLLCTAADAISRERAQAIVAQGISKLYITTADRERYQEYLRKSWRDVVTQKDQPVEQRLSVMSEVMRDVLREKYREGDSAKVVVVSQDLGRNIVDVLDSSPLLATQMSHVLHHDYATFTHSTNVALFTTLLARELGYSGQELQDIAVGALIHDIGKLDIDDRILSKPGRLDEFEFREVQRHPTAGFASIAERNDIHFGQAMMVYQHHERLDGRGYPSGLVGDEIHPWAKLCAIIDVYEALTAERPYRHALSEEAAMAILDRGDGTEFDSEMLSCWHTLVRVSGST